MINKIYNVKDLYNSINFSNNQLMNDILIDNLLVPIKIIKGLLDGKGFTIKIKVNSNNFNQRYFSLINSIINSEVKNLTIEYLQFNLEEKSPTEVDISLFAVTIDSSQISNVKIVCENPNIILSGFSLSGLAYESNYSTYDNVEFELNNKKNLNWFENSNHDKITKGELR
jgi:hypothetical protein